MTLSKGFDNEVTDYLLPYQDTAKMQKIVGLPLTLTNSRTKNEGVLCEVT